MLYGTVPFKAGNMGELHRSIMKARYTLKDDISEEARDLIKGLLNRDPKKRLDPAEIAQHPWMENIPEKMTLFNEVEFEQIRKEFTFNSCARYNRNVPKEQMEMESARSRNS